MNTFCSLKMLVKHPQNYWTKPWKTNLSWNKLKFYKEPICPSGFSDQLIDWFLSTSGTDLFSNCFITTCLIIEAFMSHKQILISPPAPTCWYLIGPAILQFKHERPCFPASGLQLPPPLHSRTAVTITTVVTLVINAPGNESVARDDVGTL